MLRIPPLLVFIRKLVSYYLEEDIFSSWLRIILRTISPPMEPACAEVKSPLYPSFKGTPISEATSCLKRFNASFASGTSTLFVLLELAMVIHLHSFFSGCAVFFVPDKRCFVYPENSMVGKANFMFGKLHHGFFC